MDLNKTFFPTLEEVPDKHKITRIDQKEYLINGTLKKWEGNQQEVFSAIMIRNENDELENYSIGSYPMLGEAEALEALTSAEKAYNHGRGLWPTLPIAERIKYVEGFVFEMIESKDEVVNLLMWEIGKTYNDSVKEFDRTVQYIKDTIEALKELDRDASRFKIEEGVIGQIRRSPLGIVLCMGPYNYPLNETFTTLIPAVIMGNTAIFKPPKYGVLLHYPILEAFRNCFPPGVINTIYGDGATIVSPLMKSGKIDALAFIGSSKVSDIIKKQHPKPHRMRSVLGLEAKNAAIVLPDADLDHTVNECVLGSLSYNGQRCTAIKILFVHRKVINSFLDLFSEKVDELKSGMPWEDVKITPLPEDGKVKYLQELIDDAKELGAKVINDNGINYIGSFMRPAILYPVTSKMRIFNEEQFGPVVPITVYDDIEEPLKYIINSDYGQQVSLFGNNSEEIAKLIDPLVNQVCRVNINSQCQRGPDTFPFTGRKDSAEGTLSVSDALRVFSIRSLVATKANSSNKEIVKEILRDNKSNFLSTDFIF